MTENVNGSVTYLDMMVGSLSIARCLRLSHNTSRWVHAKSTLAHMLSCSFLGNCGDCMKLFHSLVSHALDIEALETKMLFENVLCNNAILLNHL